MPNSDDTMISNNNLDYAKSGNGTATTTTTMATTTIVALGSSNSNGSASSSNNSSPTGDSNLSNSNTNSNSNSISTVNINSNTHSLSNTHTNSHVNPNSNSYFNRFDNRIAANLAAVITGARFRSSSCNSRQGRSPTTTTTTQPLSQSRTRAAQAAHATPTLGRRRPLQLFTQANLNCNDNEKVAQTPSSDEDNSPTELNNCKRLTDKPPLVKRLTMGLLRHNEESRPLVGNVTPPNKQQQQQQHQEKQPIYSNGYINEDSYIDSKFGDSCRQSLTAIPMLDNVNLNNDNSEFNLKKRYLRETSSANSSPKIFANRLRLNNATAAAAAAAVATSGLATSQRSSSLANTHSPTAEEEEEAADAELKDACWYQAGISRDIAVEVLQNKSPGAFLVRKSSSKPGCYALTLRVPSPPGPNIANYIILRSPRGYKIKGFRKEFSSLKALITHHSVMPELLPVPLAMPRPTNMSSSRRNLDDFDTYDSLQMLLKYLRAKNLETEAQAQ